MECCSDVEIDEQFPFTDIPFDSFCLSLGAGSTEQEQNDQTRVVIMQSTVMGDSVMVVVAVVQIVDMNYNTIPH